MKFAGAIKESNVDGTAGGCHDGSPPLFAVSTYPVVPRVERDFTVVVVSPSTTADGVTGPSDPPDGEAHVPSPRQNVDALADVPLLRFVTGRFPETSNDRSTGPHVGSPPASPCSTVVVVPMLESDLIDDVELAMITA